MLIYHCVQVEHFELRHAYQVSTILQQQRFHAKLMLDVAVVAGSRNKYRLKPFTKRHVSLRYHETDRETFARRGWCRNEQLDRARKAGADWLFFADADHIYAPGFFRHLSTWLKAHPNETQCITGAHKLHTMETSVNRLLRRTRGKFPHAKAFEQVSACRMMNKVTRPIAGGAMQVASLKRIDTRKKWPGVYIPYGKILDRHLFDECQLARSDISFRQSLGGTKVIWDLPMQIHLQHFRDKEHGNKTHLTAQR